MTIIATLLRAACAGALLLASVPAADAHRGHTRGQATEQHARAEPAPDYKGPEPHTLGGTFELTDHKGQPVTQASYPGRLKLIFFGFTSCREACPLALEAISQTLELLGPDAPKVQPLFVDFDMAGPDIKGLAQFVSNFHPAIVGLTGTRKQMFHMLRIFKVRREYAMSSYSRKETGPRIDHTTYIFIVGRDGVTRNYFYHNLPPERMAELIRAEL